MWKKAHKIMFFVKKDSLFLSILNLWPEIYFSYIKKMIILSVQVGSYLYVAVGTETVLWAARYSQVWPRHFPRVQKLLLKSQWLGLWEGGEGKWKEWVEWGCVIKLLKLYFKLWMYCSESESGPFRGEVLSSSETWCTQLLLGNKCA